MSKLWGGRFSSSIDARMGRFNDSIGFDRRLYRADIQGSIAYAAALEHAGLIAPRERQALVAGLERIRDEFKSGRFEIQPGDEDIHTAVERRLTELVGHVAGKLHTGRSRNDQVATDLRLFMLEQMAGLGVELRTVQAAIVDQAEANLEAIMPGYTHLQPAQPLRFSHWLMAYFWKLQRDQERLHNLIGRAAVSPLGAGALAGNPFDIDRGALAEALGLAGVSENSVDAVADRDYLLEFLAWAAFLQIHLSGLAEDLIIWSSQEFGFVALDEAYTTGSSLMPQKKNPDSLELLRGKSGRMVGHLVALLTTVKGLPSAYNKDLQEDKEGVFDAVDTLSVELPVVAGLMRSLRVNAGRMAAALDPAMLATDLADYLVRRGVPFRESHHLVGQAVRRAEASGCSLATLPLDEYQAIHAAFGADLFEVFDFERSVEARSVVGGTARAAVQQQIQRARALLARGGGYGDSGQDGFSGNFSS
jgi:argininosuccinate lyase